ncbi:MAG: cytoplasmic protein [Spirochaetales bacterium]|nr:cytoplasmic protein [Spirochaetales bacterium]
MAAKPRVLLVGETWFVLKMHIKGFDMVPLGGYENFGRWFVDALSKFDDIEVEHMPNHVALTSFPSTMQEINRYDVIILSDCGKNTLQLYPEMFTVPMGPDRLDVIKEFVTGGKSFVMGGGWNSFQGIRGIPGYHDTVIEEILPVNLKSSDDRVEKPQGARPVLVKKDHPMFKGLPAEWPLFLGYNRVSAKKGADVLAQINGEPFIVVGEWGKGKTMAFTSDLSKHWGTAFVEWAGYGKFWHNAVLWLSGRAKST